MTAHNAAQETTDMGLDVSHNCWNGAYGAFNRWRDELARVAGYDFTETTIPHPRTVVDLDWGKVEAKNYEGDWDYVPCRLDGTPDPLMMLLLHSDCGGHINPEHAELIADRVAELLPLLPEGDGAGHIRNWRETTQRFIDGLNAAHEANETLEFW